MDWNEFFTAPGAHDYVMALGASFLIILSIVISNLMVRLFKIPVEFTRKFVHVLAGVLASLAPVYFYSPILLLIIAGFFLIFNFWAIKRNLFPGLHGNRHSYGIVYFPLTYLILIFLFWNIDRRFILLGISLFAIPDALAAIVGETWRKNSFFTLINDKKSLPGTIMMLVSSFTLTLIVLKYFFKIDQNLVLIAFEVSLFVSIVETLSAKGSDNLFVPLSGAVLSYLLLGFEGNQLRQFLTGELLALITAVLSFYLRFLSLSGSAMLFVLASLIFGLGGWMWSVPILTFFILSSLLSKMGKQTKQKFKDTFEKSGVRDYAQVLANGGIGGILILFSALFPNNYWYKFYLLSIMISTADTWSTELGVLSKSKPRLITTFKSVEPGISGAISLVGTLGGLLGSSLILFTGLFFVQFNLNIILWLMVFSVIGNFLDSLMGATIQGQYQCQVCNKFTEKKNHCNQPTKIISGFRIVGNDSVNFFSNLFSIILFVFIRNFHL